MNKPRPFIRGQIAIESMRDNGFLSAAHALAELIDNSVQAKADRVELIAFEKRIAPNDNKKRAMKHIEKIGVFDNGSGMSKETLHMALEFGASQNRNDKAGIGRFGMGLPNSSISQCRRVDVWSWTSADDINYTYLDIDEVLNGDLELIPEPCNKDIPNEFLDCLDEKLPNSGTLVIWSEIDRCQWKTGKSIYKHTQDIVGRMYRYFIGDGSLSIRFKYAEYEDGIYKLSETGEFQANDPLYLLKNTSLPELPGQFKDEAMFELVEEPSIFEIEDENGSPHKVKVTGSVIKKAVMDEIRKTDNRSAGNTKWGKHALKNQGVSIVRAGRELSLTEEFYPSDLYKGKARFSGIEISFPPALDQIFGVTNNKQHVVNLKMMEKQEEADKEGFDSVTEYMSDLRQNNDPKEKIYDVIDKVLSVRKIISSRLSTISTESTRNRSDQDDQKTDIDPSILKMNDKNEMRDDIHPTESNNATEAEITQTLIEGGVSTEQAQNSAKKITENKLKVWSETVPLSTSAFFDITTKRGLTFIQINENHPFTKTILNELDTTHRASLELCLAGWARMERENTSERRLRQLEQARKDWGQVLEDYLDDDDE
jgi:hypothetical protein